MKNIVIALSLVILVASAVMGQTNNPQPTLVGDHPAVKAAVERYLTEQTTDRTAGSAKSTGARFATAGPVFGGGYQLQSPPVALRLNRTQYDEKGVLQSSLVVLPETKGGNLPAGPVHISHIMVNVDTGQTRGGYASIFQLVVPGQVIPIQSYIFDGSEPSGMYAYVVMVSDTNSGQLLAMPVTYFVFRNFFRSDARGYLRVDSTEFTGSRYILLRGNFYSSADPGQFAVIGNQRFPIVWSTTTEAVIDLGNPWVLPAGVYDITLVVHTAGNTAYDSTTAPAALKIFLPVPLPTVPMPPFPGPPPGKG